MVSSLLPLTFTVEKWERLGGGGELPRGLHGIYLPGVWGFWRSKMANFKVPTYPHYDVEDTRGVTTSYAPGGATGGVFHCRSPHIPTVGGFKLTPAVHQ